MSISKCWPRKQHTCVSYRRAEAHAKDTQKLSETQTETPTHRHTHTNTSTHARRHCGAGVATAAVGFEGDVKFKFSLCIYVYTDVYMECVCVWNVVFDVLCWKNAKSTRVKRAGDDGRIVGGCAWCPIYVLFRFHGDHIITYKSTPPNRTSTSTFHPHTQYLYNTKANTHMCKPQEQ